MRTVLDATNRSSRIIVMHGPPGFEPRALLLRSNLTIASEDILILAEHDQASTTWIEQEFIGAPTCQAVAVAA